jgi:hypothetical protein
VRVASRIVGVVLVLAGLVFVVGSVFVLVSLRPESVLQGLQLGRRLTAGLPVIVVGLGFILAGWYFLRLDVDKVDEAEDQPASRFAPLLLAHRRELRVIALVGLAISVVRLVALCFGHNWPAWPLVLAWVGLLIPGRQIAKPPTMDLDWQSVPQRMRSLLQAVVKAGGVAFLILGVLFAWSQWSHRQASSRIVNGGFMLLLFAWEALFFAYGSVRTDRELTTDRPTPPLGHP